MSVPEYGASFRLSQESDNDLLSCQGCLVCPCSHFQHAGQLITHLQTHTHIHSTSSQQCQVTEIHRQRDRQTDRQADRQADRYADRRTDRQTRRLEWTRVGGDHAIIATISSLQHLNVMHKRAYTNKTREESTCCGLAGLTASIMRSNTHLP